MMELKTQSTIGSFQFDFTTNVHVKSSLDELTDTATVTIPRKLNYRRNGILVNNIVEGKDPLFTRGQPVELSAGYDDNIRPRFKGFISDIVPRLPLQFSVQDRMYLMKSRMVTGYARKKITLKQLLTDILPPDMKFKALDVELGWIRCKRSNVAKVFEYLQDTYGLTCNFREDVLYAGLRYITKDPLELRVQEFVLPGSNDSTVIDNKDLVYRREDDQAIKLKAISIDDKNRKFDVEVGDSFGDQRTMYFYNIESEKELKVLAEESLSKLRYTGFFGKFTTFLDPIVRKGEAVKIINPTFPEQNGIYLVKAVDYDYGVDGGTQDIYVDIKVANG